MSTQRSNSSVNALSVMSAVRSQPQRLDETAYSRRFVKWAPTDLLGEETGFRLDVATDVRNDRVRGVRVVPTFLELEDGSQPEIPLAAIKRALTHEALSSSAVSSTQETALPPELQARVDALLENNPNKRRPNKDSIHLPAWNAVILDIAAYAASDAYPGKAAAPLVAKAFGIHLSSGQRWLDDAQGKDD